jgi:hypothetical protein
MTRLSRRALEDLASAANIDGDHTRWDFPSYVAPEGTCFALTGGPADIARFFVEVGRAVGEGSAEVSAEVAVSLADRVVLTEYGTRIAAYFPYLTVVEEPEG